MHEIPWHGHAGEGVASSAHLLEEMVFGPGLQECCALLALGRGWGGAAARAQSGASTGHLWGATGGVK